MEGTIACHSFSPSSRTIQRIEVSLFRSVQDTCGLFREPRPSQAEIAPAVEPPEEAPAEAEVLAASLEQPVLPVAVATVRPAAD